MDQAEAGDHKARDADRQPGFGNGVRNQSVVTRTELKAKRQADHQ